jgi:hypothetical protein
MIAQCGYITTSPPPKQKIFKKNLAGKKILTLPSLDNRFQKKGHQNIERFFIFKNYFPL